MKKAAVIMGSKSDLPVVQPAIDCLRSFGVEVEVRILSAHRTPEAVHEFAQGARDRGVGVIIAAAGKAAHLGGVVAAVTTLPVIGLPVKSSFMDGLDSLLSMVQMPTGIPVACVGVNAGENAGMFAAQMLAIEDESIAAKLLQKKEDMKNAVLKADAEYDA
ncbi:MAG: 5-(carboxyamino)imidazole ribonucleotide mutase [Clostridia bacterium]|nr:5-(carboxyamino)imidazole ribonucleotide mutase [Clostridia bacterium]